MESGSIICRLRSRGKTKFVQTQDAAADLKAKIAKTVELYTKIRELVVDESERWRLDHFLELPNPRFRFLVEIFKATMDATGYGDGLFEEGWLDETSEKFTGIRIADGVGECCEQNRDNRKLWIQKANALAEAVTGKKTGINADDILAYQPHEKPGIPDLYGVYLQAKASRTTHLYLQAQAEAAILIIDSEKKENNKAHVAKVLVSQ